MTNKTGEIALVYEVKLIDSLPLSGMMRQAMPNRADLDRVMKVSERTVAGYEVLLDKYQEAIARIAVLQNGLNDLRQLLLEESNQ